MAAVRISELHKGAFWIYGITAFAMHDPVSHLLAHLSSAGLADWQVRLEIWRCAVLLVLMAKFFLGAGLYFDQVYMRERSSDRYPRKSYPVDFLAGLLQFLLLVAAAVTVGFHARFRGEITLFTVLVALFVLYANLWYLAAAVLRYSVRGTLAVSRDSNNLAFAVSAFAYLASRLAGGADPVFADQAALGTLLILTCFDVGKLIRAYDNAEANPAPDHSSKQI
jgi:hypothetical protein